MSKPNLEYLEMLSVSVGMMTDPDELKRIEKTVADNRHINEETKQQALEVIEERRQNLEPVN